MAASTPDLKHSTSQRALQTLSNSRVPVNQCSPHGVLDPPYKTTPTGSVFPPNGGLKTSVTRTCPLSRRQLSKSHGDLSHLRPKSPPLYSMAGDGHCANISPGQYAEDRRDCCPPSYGRQSRQAITSGSEAGPPGSTLLTYKNATSSAGPLPEARAKGIAPSAIRIEGLTPPLLQPLDFCTPYVRSHPNYLNQDKKSGYGPIVEHLDVSTTWNGLQWAEAGELLRIHQTFIVTLEHMLARELWQIYCQSRYEASGAIGISHPLYTTGVLRGIGFCRDQLVSEMADALYSSEHDMSKARMGLFSLYLAANECLVKYNMDDSRDTSITLRVYCDPSSSTPSPIVEAAWVPDTIHFENLGESLYEGEEFSIVPQYQSNAAFGAAFSAKNVRYVVSSAHHQLSWLNWSNEIAGFKGVVPRFSEVPQDEDQTESRGRDFVPTFPGIPQPRNEEYPDNVVRNDNGNPHTAVDTLQIEIKAIFVNDNGSVVRYERVVRARITFKIVPCYAIHGSARSPRVVSIPSCGYKYTELAPGYMPLDILNAEYPSRPDKISHAPLPPLLGTQSINRLAAEPFAAPCSVTRPFFDATKISNLAQKHADLAAEYSDLAQRHADAAKHVRLLSDPSSVGLARELDLQIRSARGTGYPGHSRSIGPSLVSSHDSAYTTRHFVGSPSPIHCPNDQVLEYAAKISSLPPPAYLTPSQEFDQNTQTWNRVRTPEGSVIQSRVSVTPAREIHSETNDSISERGSRKRRARSSFSRSSQATPSKRARDDGINATQALMASTIITAEGGEFTVGESHVDPVYNPESSEAIPNLSRASSQISADTHSVPRSTSNGVEIVVEKDPQERKISRKQQAALWASSSSLGSQPARQGTASIQSPEARIVDRSSASPWRSLAEPCQTRVSSQRYCEQNNAGPQPEFNDKADGTPAKVEEPKLSPEERQALDEAISRSFDDIMGKFEDVFLDDDAGFSSTTDSEGHDEQLPEGEDV
ncbi:hypothetical protein JMJ35_007154 [Cladonia borealis]|uniref:Uncharacterized protein n=1 Tax=Cladonia borealis TaxID=184061 RepID=A0AA39QWV2_9LECA|nr:hypothetical protein JMJ35_007154 [Cladonia borealis]